MDEIKINISDKINPNHPNILGFFQKRFPTVKSMDFLNQIPGEQGKFGVLVKEPFGVSAHDYSATIAYYEGSAKEFFDKTAAHWGCRVQYFILNILEIEEIDEESAKKLWSKVKISA